VTTKRLEYADYAKAVAIFLVVLGHTHPGYLPGYGRCAQG